MFTQPSCLQPLFSNATETAAYVDALAVVEFVATFGALCEIHTPIRLSDLLRSIEDPVKHPELGILYHALLTCVLLDQVGSVLHGSQATHYSHIE